MTHPINFRVHVLKVKEERGLSARETARIFGISAPTVLRWMDDVTIKIRGPRPRKLPLEDLQRDVEEHPESYLRERAARFGVHEKTIWNGLRKLDITVKKKSRSSK